MGYGFECIAQGSYVGNLIPDASVERGLQVTREKPT
jgi:hypothetical protein